MQLENNSILELKKSNKADQENTKGLFLHFGILVSLAFVQYAFPNTANATVAGAFEDIGTLVVNEERIPEIRQEEKKSPHSKGVDGSFNVVKDKTKINHNFEVVQLQSAQDARVKGVQIVTKGKKNTDDEIFVVVENQPEFPWGELALRKFIAKSIRYPSTAQENGIQGKVYVNFVVDKDGTVLNAKIARRVDPSLDKEALRVISTLPKWKPGMQSGKAVRVSYTVPINFQLQ